MQRPLWASTSTKNPEFPDTLYVDTLIGPDTVNTLPPETLDAYLDHGTVATTVEDDVAACRAQIAQLADLGIDLDQATEELQQEGVDKFVKPFDFVAGDHRRQTRPDQPCPVTPGWGYTTRQSTLRCKKLNVITS